MYNYILLSKNVLTIIEEIKENKFPPCQREVTIIEGDARVEVYQIWCYRVR